MFGFFPQLLQSGHGALGSEGSRSVEFPGSSGDGLLAAVALPNANASPLHIHFPAEGTGVSRVLLDFELLHDLPQRRTISGTILTSDPYFLCSFSHYITDILK